MLAMRVLTARLTSSARPSLRNLLPPLLLLRRLQQRLLMLRRALVSTCTSCPVSSTSFLLARRQSNDACAIREYTTSGVWQWQRWWGQRQMDDDSVWCGGRSSRGTAQLSTPHARSRSGRLLLRACLRRLLHPEFSRPSPGHWLCDECYKGKAADLASLRSMRWHQSLLEHIRTAHPYWNRSDGADHLWPFTHDEGACYAPASLGRATLLVHWGRTHIRPNGSSEYHLWRVRPHAKKMYGWRRCYDV